MRPEILFPLFAPITGLKGVGEAMARIWARLDVTRLIDMLYHLPLGVIERLPIDTLEQPPIDRPVVVPLTVCEHRPGQGRRPTRVMCADDDSRLIALVFFSDPGGALSKRLPVGERRLVAGIIERFSGSLQMVHPDHIAPDGESSAVPLREPLYPLTEGLTNARARATLTAALARAPDLPEWHDPALMARERWPAWRASLATLHGEPEERFARRRLGYDELLASQLALALVRARGRRRRTPPLPAGRRSAAFAHALPFALTGAQARSIAEIGHDLAQHQPMLRLLQGDVGSGKTVVALAAMLQAIDGGAQAALLAPTEILARQHFATLEALTVDMDVRVALLTGRDKGQARAALLDRLKGGCIDIMVGTHAIFQEAVDYRRLGLVVIDEQHRFGVNQRLALAARSDQPPHALVMTATPIPRTLTLAVYGDMDVSRLDERPPGRAPIRTAVVALDRLNEVYDALDRALGQGTQAYWVCPLVEQSEKVDLAAAEDRAADLVRRFGPKVGLVHGRLSAAQKDRVMAAFVAGDIGILVATTVIEVGVDVPNAALMIVEQAERFGLAQLHQLRGRVGRGPAQSTCLLLRGDTLSETARARLAMMRETDDGFRIAEEDLRLRGGGELLGTRQSGLPAFKVADPVADAGLLAMARDEARLIVERDPELGGARGAALRTLLYMFERDAAIELLRSG